MEGHQPTNTVTPMGKVQGEISFSHHVMQEKFYKLTLEVPRLSGQVDVLPVTLAEHLIEGMALSDGAQLWIKGQLRSYNRLVDGASRLVLTVFALDAELIADDGMPLNGGPNEIFLDGFLCKPPVYRTTPFQREIADLLVAVNRAYGKSDYIPCIAWGRNARKAGQMKVGDHVVLQGRLQSRDYRKTLPEGEVTRTAYEVSIVRLDLL